MTPVDPADVRERILTILRKYMSGGATTEGAHDGTTLLEGLGINSARLVDIILDLEDEFGIEVSDREADGVRTVGDAVAAVVAKLS
jgi:acyl carrier protein